MKKIIIFLAILLFPYFSFASIEQNLYYGMTNNTSVKDLQQFLITKNFLTGQATGNYFSLTQNAVKKYQASKNIITTGSVGPLTRQAINTDLNLSKEPVVNLETKLITIPTTATVTTPFKGTLDLSVNSAYVSQSIEAPQLNLKLADYNLKNNTNEDINLKNIEIDLAIGDNLYFSNMYINNLYLAFKTNKTTPLSNVSHINNFSINSTLLAGQSINLLVYADINNYIPVNSVVKTSMLVSGTSAISNTTTNTNLNEVFAGQNITFSAGTLTIEKDTKTTITKMVVAMQKQNAGAFSFTAKSDSYNISELKFIIPSTFAPQIISSAFLSDAENKEVISKSVMPTYDGTNYGLNFILDIPINLNSTKIIIINYDLSQILSSEISNIDIAPNLVYVKAKNSTGKMLDGFASNYRNLNSTYGGITLPAVGVTVNELFVFKTIPAFSSTFTSDRTALNNETAELYKFNISADKNADVAVKQIKFVVKFADPDFTNPRLNYFKLFKGDVDYTNSVSIVTVINGNYIGLSSQNAIGVGIDNSVVVTFTNEEVVLAGKTQAYTLKAFTNSFSKSEKLGTDVISTNMPEDAVALIGTRQLKPILNNLYYGLLKNTSDILPTEYNILWSDRSSGFPNTHNNFNSMYTNDWYNGYGILNLPLGTQRVVAK